jgi:hypothetical protein
MLCIKPLLYRISVGIILASELAIAFNMIALTSHAATVLSEIGNSSAFQHTHSQSPPPPRRNPGSSAAGGRRNSSTCPQDAVMTTSSVLTALSPTAEPGLTLAARPTVLVYVPQTSVEWS